MNDNHISEPVRDLLLAIVETLDELPEPAPNLSDEIAHRILVENRVASVTGSLKDILDGSAPLGIAWEAEFIRRRAAEVDTVTYLTRDQALAEYRQAVEHSCGICEPDGGRES